MCIFILGIIGAITFGVLAYLFVTVPKGNTLAVFPLRGGVQRIDIEYPGRYSICFIGVGSITKYGDFEVVLSSSQGEAIPLSKLGFKPRYTYNGEKCIELWQFNINKPGSFDLVFNNVTDIEAKKTQLLISRHFQDSIDPFDIQVLVK